MTEKEKRRRKARIKKEEGGGAKVEVKRFAASLVSLCSASLKGSLNTNRGVRLTSLAEQANSSRIVCSL